MKTLILIAVALVFSFGNAQAQGSGTALTFDGIDDYLDMGDVLMLTGSDLTVELWLKTSQTVPGILAGKHHSGSLNGYHLQINAGSGYGLPDKANFYTSESAGGEAISATTINNSEWHHIVGVYTAAGTKYIYVNGELEATKAAPAPLGTNTRSFTVAGILEGAFLNGTIDEVRVWNRALSVVEIREQKHLSLTGAESGLVGYWQMDDGTGTTATDMSGSGFDGTFVSVPAWVNSTVPLGVGASASQTVSTTGQVSFPGTDLDLDFTAKTGTDDIVSTLIHTSPAGTQPPLNLTADRYWVLQQFGGGTLTADMTFTFAPGSFDEAEQANPESVILYSRETNGEGGWTQRATGVTVTEEAVTFEDVTSFSQFAVATEEPVLPPIAGYAIEFDGVDDFVQSAAPVGLPLGSASRTMEVWFRTDKDLSSSTESGIVHYGTDTVASKFGLITSSNAPGKLYFWANTIDLAGVTTLLTDTWYHAAVTYDGTTINLYLNGLLESTRTGALSTVIDADGLTVGRRSVVSLWDGQIDEVRIWNMVRTQTEIQADMNHPLSGNEAGLMTYLRFDEGSGTSTADDGPLDNTGTLTNGPVWITSTAPLVEAPLSGDADDDGLITVLDIIRVVRVIVLLDPEPTPGTDEYARFDANGDGTIDVADAISIVNSVLNILSKPSSGGTGGSAAVALGDALLLPTGESVFSVSLTSDVATAGLQMTLNYDPHRVRVGTPRFVDGLEGLEMVSNVVGDEIRVLVYSLSGQQLPSNMDGFILVPVDPIEGTSLVDVSQVIVADQQAQILPVTITNGTVRVTGAAEPAKFALIGANPNPFNPSTTISYEVPALSHITLTVYNLLGQEVIRLVDENAVPGRYSVSWRGLNTSGASVASGIYLYRLSSSTGFTSTRRMTLLK